MLSLLKHVPPSLIGVNPSSTTILEVAPPPTKLAITADNIVVDVIKLILLIYNNFNIVKKVVNEIEKVK